MKNLVIKWRLNEVMARHDISATSLAESMQVSLNAVSNLRKKGMPRLSEETLNKLLNSLNSLSQEGELITPAHLIDYTPDN